MSCSRARRKSVRSPSLKPAREWRFEGAQTQIIHVSGQLTVNNGSALLQAALAGIGIVMLPGYLVAADIGAGRLVRLFPDQDFSRAPLQLVYLPDRHMTPKLRSFIEFVMERMA